MTVDSLSVALKLSTNNCQLSTKMDIERIRHICLNLKAVTEDMPFGESTLAFRVMNKIFLLTSTDEIEGKINVKCDPELAIELRERYSDIIPGYHMNKTHWNTVYCQRELSDDIIKQQIENSYNIIVQSLKKGERELLKAIP